MDPCATTKSNPIQSNLNKRVMVVVVEVVVIVIVVDGAKTNTRDGRTSRAE